MDDAVHFDSSTKPTTITTTATTTQFRSAVATATTAAPKTAQSSDCTSTTAGNPAIDAGGEPTTGATVTATAVSAQTKID